MTAASLGAALVLLTVMLPSRAEAAVCVDSQGKPVACEQDTGGAGIIDCFAYPNCCSAVSSCYQRYVRDANTCRKLGLGATACMFVANRVYQNCLVDARANACP